MKNEVSPPDPAAGDPVANFQEALRLQRLGRLDEAEVLYRAILATSPVDPHCLLNLGHILKARGELETALSLWRTSVTNNPGHAPAFVAAGKVLNMQGRVAEAVRAFDAALAISPQDVDALNCRGNALARIGRLPDAVASYDGALAVDPHYGLAVMNRANALGALRRPEEAVAGYRQALRLGLQNPEMLGAKLFQQMQICDWSDHAEASAQIAQRIGEGAPADLPFTFLAHSDDPAAQLACAQIHARGRFPVPPPPLWNGEAYRHEKIRVAYVSADFYTHATAHLIAGLFERHDTSRFEITSYALGPSIEDDKRQRIRAAVYEFHDVSSLSDLEIARRIRAAEVDIVVDLKGYTTHCRPGIFAHRPAPIQISYLGFPATMGVDFMDYLLADSHVIPAGSERFYSEQIIRLPHSYQVNDRRGEVGPPPLTRAQAGLPADGFVFASFNANYKLTPQVFDVWMRLLRQVEGSVLWLLHTNDAVVRNLSREAHARGVSPDRLIFAPRAPLDEHLARHRLADLFVDSLPISAHTTASDALWAGLPLVTCVGRSFASRVAAGLLHAVGLPELITESLEAYEALALALATHPERLADLKARLAAQIKGAPLFDTDLSRRHIEAAYAIAWQRQQRGEPPAAFDVPA
ncbi:MAG: tetratricopeptide repeat protein [Phenylobacterium sp.]|nr:tetratricopeptide repeat protein [Phenylobacterium sp.]